MAIFHFTVNIISRSNGRSAVGAAAYRSGEKIENLHDGIVHDYTRKRGIADTIILLPPQAPKEYFDRGTLWNAVERVEKSKKAQLARDIELSLPRELPFFKQRRLAIEFVRKNFVDGGMCADICFHDKGDGNPHAHIMLTMRPINADGSWGQKQKKEYILDENGNKIYDKRKRQYKCNSIPTTDWNEQYKCEEWRKSWADFVNQYLKKNFISERVDHRSYKRQGIDRIPTIHLGPVASQMEKKGRLSERGRINRQIKEDNRLLHSMKVKLKELTEAAKKAFDEKVKEFSSLLFRIRSRFIVTVYQDINNDVEEAKLKTSLNFDEKAVSKCVDLEQQIANETDWYKQYDLKDKLYEAYSNAGFYTPKDVERATTALKDRDRALAYLVKQKEILHQNLDDDMDKRARLTASLSPEEFGSVLATEYLHKSKEDEKTRTLLKDFYGSDYREMVFEEAVKCTDKELSSRKPHRNHTEIVEKVLATERTTVHPLHQNNNSRDYTPPERGRGR